MTDQPFLDRRFGYPTREIEPTGDAGAVLASRYAPGSVDTRDTDTVMLPPGGGDLLPYERDDEPPPYIPTFGNLAAVRPPTLPAASVEQRDRIWPHLIWEAVLLAGCVATAVLLMTADKKAFSGGDGRELMIVAAIMILLGSAFALSLRAAAPNLAVGAIAVAAASGYVWLLLVRHMQFGAAIGSVLGAGAAAGLLIALIVGIFGVPAWATSLGGGVLLTGALAGGAISTSRTLGGNEPTAIGNAGWWLAGAVVASVLGGLLLVAPGTRRLVGGGRPVSDPAERPPLRATVGTMGALAGSGLLAAAAGLLLTAAPAHGLTGLTGLTGVSGISGVDGLTGLAVATALLGGVSAFGRRAGIFGVALAGATLVLGWLYLVRRDARPWALTVEIGAAVLVGLLVTRTLERASRRPARYLSR